MKTIYSSVLITILAIACSKPADKKTELADLKKQSAEMQVKIKNLEKELGVGASNSNDKPKIKLVSIASVERKTFKHFVEVQGTVDALNNIMVGSRMGGGVYTRINVREGDSVKKGQILAETENTVMKDQIESLKTQMNLASIIFEKQTALWQQKIGTEVQYLQAKANKESIEKQLTLLNSQLALTKIISPIDGVVDEIKAKIGELAAPGMSYIRVVNTTNLKVVAKVSDIYLGTVRKGDAVTVVFPDINQKTGATIRYVSANVSPLSRTFTVEIPVANLGGGIKANQLATVKINDLSKAGAIVIAQNLVQITENGATVMVAIEENGKKVARAKIVKTGLSYNGEIEILLGLTTADQLITEGYQELVDGQEIAW